MQAPNVSKFSIFSSKSTPKSSFRSKLQMILKEWVLKGFVELILRLEFKLASMSNYGFPLFIDMGLGNMKRRKPNNKRILNWGKWGWRQIISISLILIPLDEHFFKVNAAVLKLLRLTETFVEALIQTLIKVRTILNCTPSQMTAC